MRRARAIVLFLFPLAGVAFGACVKDPPACYPNEYQGCYCADAGADAAADAALPLGYAVCAPSQDGFGVCVCNGTTPGLDSGPPPREAGSGDGSGGKTPPPPPNDGGVDADASDSDADAEGGI